MKIKVILFCFLLGSINPVMCNDQSKTSNEVVESKEKCSQVMVEVRDCLNNITWEMKKLNMITSLINLGIACLVVHLMTSKTCGSCCYCK